MALIRCRECKKEISSSAKACPFCGAPARKSHAVLFAFIAILGGGGIFLLCYNVKTVDQSQSNGPQEPPHLVQKISKQLLSPSSSPDESELINTFKARAYTLRQDKWIEDWSSKVDCEVKKLTDTSDEYEGVVYLTHWKEGYVAEFTYRYHNGRWRSFKTQSEANPILINRKVDSIMLGFEGPSSPLPTGTAGQQPADKDALEIKAKAGDVSAQYGLGCIYRDGKIVTKDDAKSFEWFLKAAAQGDAASQGNLGFMYQTGSGVSKDDQKAAEWYQRAALQGDAFSQGKLGIMYIRGAGVPKDEAKAFAWYQKAAVQGNPIAQCNLGLLYADGNGVSKDEAKAVEWFNKSALQGYADAQCSLAVMYENGRGISKDDQKAAEWYQKAAVQGDAAAQGKLGFMYATGMGVQKDEPKAFTWFEKAALQGNAKAQGNLGFMYTEGRGGVSKDNVKALAWYNLAVASGDVNASQGKAKIEKLLTAEQKAVAQRLSGELLMRFHEN